MTVKELKQLLEKHSDDETVKISIPDQVINKFYHNENGDNMDICKHTLKNGISYQTFDTVPYQDTTYPYFLPVLSFGRNIDIDSVKYYMCIK